MVGLHALGGAARDPARRRARGVSSGCLYSDMSYRVSRFVVHAQVNATRLAIEVVSDLDGALQDSLELIKPKGWGERFMRAQQIGVVK